MAVERPLRIGDVGRIAVIDGLNVSPKDVEVGILIFDVEHREMLAQLGHLYECVEEERPAREVRAAMSKLLATTKKHFDHEEGYMRDLGYAQLAAHKADHDGLSQQLEEVVAAQLRDVGNDRDAVRLFFKTWLLEHIIEHDRAFAAFMAHKNIR